MVKLRLGVVISRQWIHSWCVIPKENMASNGKPRKKNFAKNTNEMSKEMLVETLKKKRECNTRALAIVERLCDTSSFNEDWLLSNLEYINQSHFDDVIVERAILKMCGYPLCNIKLENVPSKKYHISTRLNKVYDITERKNFCSSVCYKAGMYLKSQLLTSPLWIRDQEVIPKFQLLPCNSSASMGEEVVFLAEKEKIKQEILSEKDEVDVENICHTINKTELKSEDIATKNCDVGKSENTLETEFAQEHNDTRSKESEFEEVKIIIKETTFGSDEKTENVKKIKEEKYRKNMYVVTDPVRRVEQCIYEWFSFDTVLYLYGEEKVKDLMRDRKDEIRDIIGKKPLVPGYNKRIDRMIQFYSLLDQQVFDSELANKNLKPLPDYSALKEDGKKLEIKVQAFYSGQLEVKECDVPDKKDAENDGESEIYLPTVDSHAQNALRVKILLDRFNKIIPELIRTFTTASCFEMSELRNLVDHFTLSAHNITFKPGEWYLVGFIVIKLLSVKNRQLDCLLNGETGRKNVTLFLMNYDLPGDYLEKIVDWLVNDESLIRKLK